MSKTAQSCALGYNLLLMRKSSDWMTIWDDRILEVIREGGPSSASELKKNKYIRISRPTITRRLNKLADHELLDRLPNGVFTLSDKGQQYLNGEIDAEKLESSPQNKDNEATA